MPDININIKPFENKDRKRYYGLRVGDIVEASSLNGTIWGRTEVVELGHMDNNSVMILSEKGNPIKWVAEWCKIIAKVEDRNLSGQSNES